MWDLWWTKWQFREFLYEVFGPSPVSVTPPMLYHDSYISRRRHINLGNRHSRHSQQSSVLTTRAHCTVTLIVSPRKHARLIFIKCKGFWKRNLGQIIKLEFQSINKSTSLNEREKFILSRFFATSYERSKL
jgi:hypothetical protein